MARFWQRTKDQLTAPAQYIQTTDSVSRPMAVMLALVMFFIACALIVSIFFVGKWGYEQVTGKNDAPADPITGISTGGVTDSKVDSSTTSPNTNGATVTPTTGGTATVTTNQPAASSSVSTTQNTGSQSTTTAATVPNTGAGSTLLVFVISSSIGMFIYRAILVRRLS